MGEGRNIKLMAKDTPTQRARKIYAAMGMGAAQETRDAMCLRIAEVVEIYQKLDKEPADD